MSKVVEVINLSKKFGDFHVVNDVTFAMNPGEILGFLGPNGAGKSTCLKMMSAQMRPTFGQVRIFGMDPFVSELEVKRKIGVVPEKLNLYDRLTGRELGLFIASVHGIEEKAARLKLEHLFDLLELSAKADSFIGQYSQGMKRKMALITALIHNPGVLFLDEPFNGMDALSVIHVKTLLEDLRKNGTAILFSSHILEIVEKICTRIVIISAGKICAQGTKEEILKVAEHKNLDDFFLSLARGKE